MAVSCVSRTCICHMYRHSRGPAEFKMNLPAFIDGGICEE